MYCSFLPSVASVISTFTTTADRRNAVGHGQFRILLSNQNMQLLFSVSPSAIPESNMQSAQVHLPGSRKELMTHAGLMDPLHVYVRVCISEMLEVRLGSFYDLTPHPHAAPIKMEGRATRAKSWQVNSLKEGVSFPGHFSTSWNICCVSEKGVYVQKVCLKIATTQPCGRLTKAY